MLVAPGGDVTASLVAPGVSRLGARIEDPVTRAIHAYWREAALDPATGTWTVTLDPPLWGGDYMLVWRDGGPEPPAYERFVPLTVS